MKKVIIVSGLLLFQSLMLGQQNCEVLNKDSECYQACLKLNEEGNHRQGSYSSQKYLTDAIELCPSLSTAYFEKSVAYLKRGMFIEWKELIDKAVSLNPSEHLSYRAWCQFAFLHNYEETIKDIDSLTNLVGFSSLGTGQSGDYDLRIVLALSYKLIGKKKKSIEIIENLIKDEKYNLGLYDYLHLGVLYLENNQLEKAKICFQNQIEENELSEVYYYLGKTHLLMKNDQKVKKNIEESLKLYKNRKRMHSNYYEYIDQIYEQDIIDLIEKMERR